MELKDLNDGAFFFFVGDSKVPYRKLGNGYINMSNCRVLGSSLHHTDEVKVLTGGELREKYKMSQGQFDAWVQHVNSRIKRS